MTIIGYGDSDIWNDQISVNGTIRFRSGLTGIGTNPLIMWQARVLPGDSLKTPLLISANDVIYTSRNTTKASDGTLKAASPIVQIFKDGDYQLNDESEGCTVSRLSVGEYLIEGCTGLNADAAWCGIDGGFDIPTDRNKQPLVWLDYEVNADGSVLVRTYHRTHPAAPEFARNEITGLTDGEPIDIPKDQFVSVRVEMPESSIWNQQLKAISEECKMISD